MTLEDTLKKVHLAQEKLNCFVTIIDDVAPNKKYIAIKDNFSTKNILSTGSSNTLKDYMPFFDATVITKLKNNGYDIIGKTVMDELGMGGTGKSGHTGIVKNPWNPLHITGGSSAGSAAAVAAGIIPYAIGSDTGDSIRKPAAWCGIVGFKPTYGLISRYGLFPFASSMDHVGVMARNVEDIAKVTDDIKGIDENDMTSWDSSNINLTKELTQSIKNKKLFYIKEICDENEYPNANKELKQTLTTFKNTLKKCEELGLKIEEVSIDRNILNAIYPTYFSISCAEATSNFANLTGIAFGPRGKGKTAQEQIIDHRTKGFGPLIKKRFIIGSYVLQAENQEKYFLNACRLRRIIVNKINDLFNTYDGLILPATLEPAPLINGEMSEYQKLEQYLAIANFGGFPSITIPNGFVNNLPIGINITGKIKDDANVLNIAYHLEAAMEYKNQIAKGWE